jgi:chemotaxis regulatin CheY-phosphate phosphatase CheZ
MRLSERLARTLADATDRENEIVMMTTGAADELIALIEAAEAVVDLAPPEYHRQLDQAISRLRSVLD